MAVLAARCREFDGPLSSRASPLRVTAVSAGSRGCRVRIKRSHSDADSLSVCGSKFPGSGGVSLRGEGVTKPSRGSERVPRKGFRADESDVGRLYGVKMQFLCNARRASRCVFCQNDVTRHPPLSCTRDPTRLRAVWHPTPTPPSPPLTSTTRKSSIRFLTARVSTQFCTHCLCSNKIHYSVPPKVRARYVPNFIPVFPRATPLKMQFQFE